MNFVGTVTLRIANEKTSVLFGRLKNHAIPKNVLCQSLLNAQEWQQIAQKFMSVGTRYYQVEHWTLTESRLFLRSQEAADAVRFQKSLNVGEYLISNVTRLVN